MGLDLHLGRPSGTADFAQSLKIELETGEIFAEKDGKYYQLVQLRRPDPEVNPMNLEDIEDARYHHYDYVDWSEEHARWSYGGFHRFRDRLAATIGVTLEDMRGFSGDKVPVIEWEDVDSGLVPLLHHSDCDGELSPEDCKTVFPALRKAIAGWTDGDYDKEAGYKLASMMERAAAENLTLLFR